MDSATLTLELSKLRRGLEEILALVSDGVDGDGTPKQAPLPDPVSVEGDPCVVSESRSAENSGACQSGDRDELFEEALEVVIEFGNASPAILQMWLSIDYSRAARILSQLEAQGMVTGKGKVRDKAYERRGSVSRA